MAHTIINIGRQYESGGKAIAEEISSILSIPFYDNELITKAAEASGFNPELFRQSDEELFKKDRERAEYYNFFSFGHWGKSSDYDLCIDSSILGIKGTAEMIVEFGKKAGIVR